MPITESDLLKLENRINKEQQEARHVLTQEIAKLVWDSSENKTNQLLIQQSMDFQKQQMEDIKKILLEFIDAANEKFATKNEMEDVKNTYKWLVKSAL